MKFLLILCFICSIFSILGGKRTLVIEDNPLIQQTHNIFFESLKQKGYELTFKHYDDSSIELESYGKYFYDNLIILNTKDEKLSGSLSKKNILDFVNEGNNNLFIATQNEINENLREIASDCGIEIDATDSLVKDHFSFDQKLDSEIGEGEHTIILSNNNFFGNEDQILFNGLGMKIDKNNHLLIPFLKGSKTSYSRDKDEKYPHVAGESTTLVAGLQSRKNARITFVGSLAMLSDKYINSKVTLKEKQEKSGNKEFIDNLLEWSFQEKGILRHRNVFIAPPDVPPYNAYKISTDLHYSVIIEEWNGSEWTPFNGDDVQLEFTMVDPYIRLVLDHDNEGKYSTVFKIPDVYGVFKCVVDYRRKGYSILHFEDQVTVRPTRTNEFERFIQAANPYYITVFLMALIFFFFVFVLLFLKKDSQKQKTQ